LAETIVVALGGNAFMKKKSSNTLEEQWRNVDNAAQQIVALYSKGYRVLVTHGNGPQVGMILEWMEALKEKFTPLTMDIATAMTQGWLGYMLMQAIGNRMVEAGYDRKVVALVNQVIVDPSDPGFRMPTKPVGPYYSGEQAKKLEKEKGWVMRRDPRGGYRRVVPSPDPLMNVEADAIKSLLESNYIVIASGGGGIPVFKKGESLQGVEAVVDKDLASEIIASTIGASMLVIATDVDAVYLGYGSEKAERLGVVRVDELKELYRKGLFPPGSMGPKVLACIRFVERNKGKAVITSLETLEKAVEGSAGTLVIP